MIDVRRVEPEEWAELRDVRLRALLDAPSAFASTHAREAAFGEGEWRARIEGGPWWLAVTGGVPVGLVAGYRTGEDGDVRHLVAMWVHPEYRGSGAAARLVDAVRAWAADDGGRVLSLWVADGNDRARRFYARLGFAGTGDRQPLPSDPRIGEERLALRLR